MEREWKGQESMGKVWKGTNKEKIVKMGERGGEAEG